MIRFKVDFAPKVQNSNRALARGYAAMAWVSRVTVFVDDIAYDGRRSVPAAAQ
jgi:hypothetical protein